jgi:hypothetical protein
MQDRAVPDRFRTVGSVHSASADNVRYVKSRIVPSRTTGELSDGNGRYRCWTASRHWGDSMADIRAAQAAWWADQRATAGAPEAPSGALLDSNSQSYETGLVERGIGGCD